VHIGSVRFMQQKGFDLPEEHQERLAALEKQGKTVLLVHDGEWAGMLALADRPRHDARKVVMALRASGVEHIVMLTGDNERVAASIAEEVGIDDYYARLLPDDKVKVVRELGRRYGNVAMVGDGVNDAPALASARIGIAMGAAGTDVALETADVVLMSDDLTNLPYMIRLSTQARRIVWQNLVFSLGVIVTLILGTFGLFGSTLPLPLGIIGHEGSTVIVVFIGLRLITFRGGRLME
jgi:Cd2+/Zn2+-exporting ATPase